MPLPIRSRHFLLGSLLSWGGTAWCSQSLTYYLLHWWGRATREPETDHTKQCLGRHCTLPTRAYQPGTLVAETTPVSMPAPPSFLQDDAKSATPRLHFCLGSLSSFFLFFLLHSYLFRFLHASWKTAPRPKPQTVLYIHVRQKVDFKLWLVTVS